VSLAEPISSNAGYLPVGHYGANSTTPLRLTESRFDALTVTARRGAAHQVRAAAQTVYGFDLPLPGRIVHRAPITALGLTPIKWLILSAADGASTAARHGQLAAALQPSAIVVDTGHGQVVFVVSGAPARVALAKICRLDLHPAVFTPDHNAQTIMAQIPVTLWQIDLTPCFALAVPLTFAQSFAMTLLTIGAEFGIDISPQSASSAADIAP
jgi:heterotetrameric sarcosine oxidase gamma subunit